MYTKEQLKENLKEMGLLPNDSIMVHSSMKSIGLVEGGAETVIDAIFRFWCFVRLGDINKLRFV